MCGVAERDRNLCCGSDIWILMFFCLNYKSYIHFTRSRKNCKKSVTLAEKPQYTCLNLFFYPKPKQTPGLIQTPTAAWCHQTRAGNTTKPANPRWSDWKIVSLLGSRVALRQQHDKVCLLTLQESMDKNLLIRAVIQPLCVYVCVCVCVCACVLISGSQRASQSSKPAVVHLFACIHIHRYVACIYSMWCVLYL